MLPRIALALSFLSMAVVSAQQPPPSDATVLSVSRVILYKTGIGYFEHLATVTGNQSLAVQFTGDQLDDVLKSLTAVDLGDGRITGISYDSPTPTERRLQALRVPLAQNASTRQVLDALRGSRVEVRRAGAVVTGRLLNVERRVRQTEQHRVEQDEITVVTDAGEIVTVDLDSATRVRVVDADLRQDVGRYLDIASSHGDRSPRRVVLSTVGNGQRQVLVSYVGEAAVWKTTYRLVFPSAGDGRPLLQGWAVVDNLSAADWDGVELSLVAGAPQAFRQPLSTPLFAVRPLVPLAASSNLVPQTHDAALVRGAAAIAGVVRDGAGAVLPGTRVTVRDQSRTQIASATADGQGRYQVSGLPAGAVELSFELPGFNTTRIPSLLLPSSGTLQRDVTLSVGGLQESVTVSAEAPRAPGSPAETFRGGGVGRGTGGGMAPSRDAIEQRMLEQEIGASGADLGELFEYRLKDRVTIRRNQSALVPILQTTVTAERISLWNAAMGRRPRRAVWLHNTSDLTLDAGSLSIVDAGAFAGEGLIEPLTPGERRLVSFALDSGVQVAARPGDSPGRVTRIRIAKGVVTEDTEQHQRRTYTIRNDDRQARTVIVEHPVRPDWKLAKTLTPDESTAAVHRFRVTAAPGQTTTFDVDEIRVGSTTAAVGEFHRDFLMLMADGTRREVLERAMAPVFAKRAELDAIEADIQQRREEVNTIRHDQDRVRQNMAVLKGSSAERQLLERYTRQLNTQETRLEQLERELAGLLERQGQVQRQLADLIMAVTVDVPM
jgi:hypothetical protein